MATKFGYVERQATNNIDWSAIGSQVVKNLQEEATIREQKKDAIDQASREMAKTLREAPTGENLTMNEFTLDYANNAQQLLLQQDRLLKAGLLNPKDYAVVRANLNESTDELFNLSKEYQAEYSNKMERMKSGQSQELEIFLMASAEGLANIKNGKALIDPDTGVVSIGTWKDGKMDGDPASYATVNEVRNRINSTYDIYDLNVEIASQVNLLGGNKMVQLIKALGGGDVNQVITTMDQEQRKDYTQWENNTIASMMNNPFHVTSILTENIDITNDGKAYEFTFSEEEFKNDKTGSLIFLDRSEDPNGQPVFKPEQEEAVKKRLQEDIRAQLNKEQDMDISAKSYAPNYGGGRGGGTQAIQENAVLDFATLFYGTQEQKEVAASNLRALNDDISSIEQNADNTGIEITYDDGRVERIPYGSSQEDFIKRGVNFALSSKNQITDVNEMSRQAGVDLSRGLSTASFSSIGAGQGIQPGKNQAERASLAKQAYRQLTGAFPMDIDNRFYEQIYYANEDEILAILRGEMTPQQEEQATVVVEEEEEKTTAGHDGNPR